MGIDLLRRFRMANAYGICGERDGERDGRQAQQESKPLSNV